MQFRQLSKEEFKETIERRYLTSWRNTRKLHKEFDVSNRMYQMASPLATGPFGADPDMVELMTQFQKLGKQESENAPADVMGAESLYGALFIHSKLCITAPDCHCMPCTNDYSDIQAAKYATMFFDYVNEQYKLASRIEKSVYLDTAVFGNGILYVGWDGTMGRLKSFEETTGEMEMTGDFIFRRVSPYDFMIDNNAESLEEANWCFERHEVPIEELAYQYPEKRDIIVEFHKREADEEHASDKYEKKETLIVLEYWEKQLPWNAMRGRHAVFLVARENENDKTPPDMICIRIEDNAYSHGGLPYAMLSDIDIPKSPWGMSRLSLVVPTQANIDRILSVCLDNTLLHGSIHLCVPDGTYNKDSIRTDDPTSIIHWNAAMANGQKPIQLQPTTVSHDFWRQYDLYAKTIERIFGAGEFSKGEIPRELSGFAVLTAIDMEDKFRIRLFNKKIDFLKELYLKILSIAQQYMPPEVEVGLSGVEKNSGARYFKVADLNGSYDVKVGYGRFMPKDPSAAKEYLFQLVNTGIFEQAGGDFKRLASLLLDGSLVELQNHQDGGKNVQHMEVVRLLNGEQCRVVENQDHEAHLEVLNELINTVFFEGLPEDIQNVILAHNKSHVDIFAKLQAAAEPPPEQGGGAPAEGGGAPAGGENPLAALMGG